MRLLAAIAVAATIAGAFGALAACAAISGLNGYTSGDCSYDCEASVDGITEGGDGLVRGEQMVVGQVPDADDVHDAGMDGREADPESVVDAYDEAPIDVTTEDALPTDALDSANETANEADVQTGEDAPSDVEATGDAGTIDACTQAGPEICTNGIDDDCNGLADCADPACAAYVCAPPVPSGWSGPVEFWEGSNPATPPACQTTYANPIDVSAALTAPAASCGSCMCSASGQTCSAIMANIDSDTACASACPAVSVTSGSCVNLTSCGGASFSMSLPAPTVKGGTCNPSAGSVTVPAPSWMNSARLCSYAGPSDSPGGCSMSGARCVLAPTSSYHPSLCVYSTAAPAPSSCPAPYNAVGPSTFYSGITDTRACSGCSCAATPSGGSCSGTLTTFAGSGCSGATAAYTLGSGCKALSDSPQAASLKGAFTLGSPGSCSVQSQPAPTGAATATGPTTVCCM